MKSKIKLLLVDDEPILCETIISAIDWEQFGIEVMGSCENAMDALDLMINEAPDILITDIKMPVMSGLDLIAKAKQINPALECLVLSGYADFSYAKSALELRVNNYLLKPFSVEELNTVLEKLCSQIANKRQEKRRMLEWRRETVGSLITDLQTLKTRGGKVDKNQVQNLMGRHQDVSLLYEAMTLLMLNYATESHSKQLETLSSLHLEDESKLYEIVADSLNKISLSSKTESKLVTTIKDYTKEHYTEEGTNLQYIADNLLHLGVRYVGKQFLKETGIRYCDYLTGLRMERAKQLLAETDSVDSVAEQIGLGHDIPYFYRLFKKSTGMTPKQYKTK